MLNVIEDILNSFGGQADGSRKSSKYLSDYFNI
jgi:hypothetical protein